MRRLKIVMVLMVLFSTLSLTAQPGQGQGGGQGQGQGQDQGERPQRGQQESLTPEEMALRRTEMLNRIVELDTTQMESIYNLMMSQYEPLPSQKTEEEVKELSRKERNAYQEILDAEREAREAEYLVSIYEVLTPPQIEKYEAFLKQQEERQQQRGQGQGGQGQGQRSGGGGQGRM